MTKRNIRLILNILIFIGVCIVLINIITGKQTGLLAVSGFSTFRYFTTLSNLLEALAALIFIISAIAKRGKPIPKFVEVIKYIASAEVFVTFMTIAAFLGPLYGYVETCSGNNFWFHLVIPIAAILEQIFLSERKMGLKENLYVMIPTFIYGCAYVINIMINGKGEWPQTNDWYGFLNWGYPVGVVIFIVMCAMAFLLGLILRGLWKLTHRKG